LKKIFLFVLLLIATAIPAQQKINWGEILYGNIQGLRKNKIKTLKLKKGNKVFRSVEVISGQEILVKDSLSTQSFYFDDKDRIISLKSNNDNWKQTFQLNFKDDYVNQLLKTTDHNGIVVFNKFSKVSFRNTLYEERDIYSFDTRKNDSLNVFRIKYFFNHQNPDLSFKETYNNGKIWTKKYFNQTEVTKEIFDNHYKVDSILQKGDKFAKYHFDNYPDHQNIRIENDSVWTIHKKNGKMISEKLEYGYLPFREVFYDENENVKERIVYKHYKNVSNEWVLWEKIKYNGNGKRLKREFPNKDTYNLVEGKLVYKENTYRVSTKDYIDESGCRRYRRDFFSFSINLYSPSILFNLKFAKSFLANIDTYDFEKENELIYTQIDFFENLKITADYSASKDVKDEMLRTSRSVKRKECYVKKYFEGLEVEAETVKGKKYTISLSENPQLLSFPIHIFLTKEDY